MPLRGPRIAPGSPFVFADLAEPTPEHRPSALPNQAKPPIIRSMVRRTGREDFGAPEADISSGAVFRVRSTGTTPNQPDRILGLAAARLTRGICVNTAKNIYFWIFFSFIIVAASNANAETVIYALDNVILDDNDAQMSGTLSWTFDFGDFENGVGIFTFLDIPFTSHDHTDLDAAFDIGKSIEITLEGSVHDDGVDITLFLVEPLTPTTSSLIDLVQSKYEIGGNGFHDGLFLSGSVEVVPEPGGGPSQACGVIALALLARMRARRAMARAVDQGQRLFPVS
jgi:hypothetical protein